MRFSGQRHPNFNLDGGMSAGPKNIIRAAKDPVSLPQGADVLELLSKSLCRVTLGENCYEVRGMDGTVINIPYGVSMDVWVKTCAELLKLALDRGL